ncbi:MAG: Bax inhibitor-1/YccA family protein [Sulfuricella sp.]|nr:Bax inhibitor-1/YccA family protein [Sulfuricella sp.]
MQPELHTVNQNESLSGYPVDLAASTAKVLRNTYMMLSLTMIPTVIGAFIGMSMNFALLAQHPVLGFVGMLAVMFGLFWGVAANRNSGIGVALLLVLTLFLGVMLGPILQVALHLKNGAQLVGLAAGGTGVIFFGLAGFATVSKKDFSFLGKFLFIGLALLILASFANLFFQVPAMALTISAIAVLIFSGYILYDVSQIVHGGETNYVMATLALYLDIYNLFVNLLQLLMALSGERD